MSVQNKKDGKVMRFEDALDRTGFGLYSYLVIAIGGLISVSFVFLVYGVTFIVPASACEFNTTSAQQGLAVATPVSGAIVGTVVWGYLANTRGRRKVLLAGLLLSAATNALGSLSVHWIMLMAMQLLTVILATGQYTLAMTIVSESVPMAKQNVAVLLVNSMMTLAYGLMALTAIPIIPLSFSHYIEPLGIYWNSWRTLQVVFSVPSLLSAAGLYFLQESPKYAFAMGEEERALNILKEINRVNKGKQAEEFDVTGLCKEEEKVEVTSKSQFMPLFKRPHLKNFLLLAVLFLAVYLIAAVQVWLPAITDQFASILATGEGSDLTLCDILKASFDAPKDPDAVPCSLHVMGLLIVLGTSVFLSIVNTFLSQIVGKLGNRYTAMISTLVTGSCGLLINLVPNAIGTILLLSIFSVGAIVLGIYAAITVALFPTQLRAMAISILLTFGYICNFGLTQFFNYMLIINCELIFYLYASLFLASALILFLLPEDRPGKLKAKKIDKGNLDTEQCSESIDLVGADKGFGTTGGSESFKSSRSDLPTS